MSIVENETYMIDLNFIPLFCISTPVPQSFTCALPLFGLVTDAQLHINVRVRVNQRKSWWWSLHNVDVKF